MATAESTEDLLVGVVLLVDSDPPSGHGEIGLYVPEDDHAPPDVDTFWSRHNAIASFIKEWAPGTGAVTVHTSQRYRMHMLEQPFLSAWHEIKELGVDLVLHPHEERADGTPRYDETDYITRVVTEFADAAGSEGLNFSAFRSGFFAFNEELPSLLAKRGIGVDLSAASGLNVPDRGVHWEVGIDEAFEFPAEPRVIEIPLGWSGQGTNLDQDYLFNERQDLAGLKRVFDAIRSRAQSDGRIRLVNLLCHGHGLAREPYRRQLAEFIEYLLSRSAALLDIDSAVDLFRRNAKAVTAPRGG